jgi:hypothetical protein
VDAGVVLVRGLQAKAVAEPTLRRATLAADVRKAARVVRVPKPDAAAAEVVVARLALA